MYGHVDCQCLAVFLFRDGSACVSHLRIPATHCTGLVDKWLEHRFLREGEKEFPLRNDQVKALHGLQ